MTDGKKMAAEYQQAFEKARGGPNSQADSLWSGALVLEKITSVEHARSELKLYDALAEDWHRAGGINNCPHRGAISALE